MGRKGSRGGGRLSIAWVVFLEGFGVRRRMR